MELVPCCATEFAWIGMLLAAPPRGRASHKSLMPCMILVSARALTALIKQIIRRRNFPRCVNFAVKQLYL
eukprot:2060459-Amphidinium_carterae.1